MLSSIGHDLRTPLTAIIAAAAELRQHGDPGSALVATVSAEAAKLERYISNLLDMARIESGAVKLKLEPVDLVDAVSAALRDLKTNLLGHAIDVSLADDLPLVRADPDLLHHCLINLLDNAGRHSTPNSPIHIRARSTKATWRCRSRTKGQACPTRKRRSTPSWRSAAPTRKAAPGSAWPSSRASRPRWGLPRSGHWCERPGAAFILRFPEQLTLSAMAAVDGE